MVQYRLLLLIPLVSFKTKLCVLRTSSEDVLPSVEVQAVVQLWSPGFAHIVLHLDPVPCWESKESPERG